MNYSATGEQLKEIADTIRSKTGKTALLSFPDGFTNEIGNINRNIASINTSHQIKTKQVLIKAGNYIQGQTVATIRKIEDGFNELWRNTDLNASVTSPAPYSGAFSISTTQYTNLQGYIKSITVRVSRAITVTNNIYITLRYTTSGSVTFIPTEYE